MGEEKLQETTANSYRQVMNPFIHLTNINCALPHASGHSKIQDCCPRNEQGILLESSVALLPLPVVY